MDLSKHASGAPQRTHLPPQAITSADPRDPDDLAHLLATLTADTRSIGEILVARGLLDESALPQLRGLPGGSLPGRALSEDFGLSEEDLQRASACRLGIPFVDPTEFEIERRAIEGVSAAIARRHVMIPVCFIAGGLIVAIEDPDDRAASEALALNTDFPTQFVVAPRDAIERAIARWYGADDDREVLDELSRLIKADDDGSAKVVDLAQLGEERPVVRLVHNILLDAIQHKASDIHLRPLEERVDLLFRVDGALVPMRSFDKSMLGPVVSRIKIVGNMDIAEHRLPQDGRFRISRDGSEIDLRMSVIPTVQGESVVIRILNGNAGLKSIDELGFSEPDAVRFAELLDRSTGMLLVTGPTGCGKSTTLYAALQQVRQRDVNIVTVEDPVEYRLEGVNQIQVNPATGLTFGRALRHILRHDPDVVMVGEIRDLETAKMAVESSLTGHLVLSTLHTNDAASAVTRMLELGIEPYLVKTSLIAVLAQRLVRRNCPDCTEEESISAQVRQLMGVGRDEVFHRGAGCPKCLGTGYRGRRSVYELLPMSDAVRDLMTTGASSTDIARCAISGGMEPLTENAINVARSGETSLAEAYRVRLL